MKRLISIALLVVGCGGAAATTAPTPQPTAVPIATVTPVITPDPEPEVTGGTGKVTFGKGYDPDTLAVTGEAKQFKRTVKSIAWSASFIEPAGATSVTLIVASQSKSGAETVLIKTDVDISDPSFDTLANKIDLASIVNNKAGTYVMRYLRDSTVLAQGSFTLVK